MTLSSPQAELRWLALVAVCGCGRVAFDTRSDASDGGVAASCNAMSRLHDTFDGALDNNKWGGSYINPGTMLVQTGGEVVLTPSSTTADIYVGLRSYRYYDLRGQREMFEVSQVTVGAATAGIQLEYGGTEYLGLSVKNGTLFAARRDGATYDGIDAIPYDAAAHRFFAFSERDGTVYYETSTDGTLFTPFAMVPLPFDVSLVRAVAYAGTDTVIAAPGEAHYASVGAPAGPTGSACAASSLQDRFDGTTLAHRWVPGPVNPCCTVSQNGALQLTTDGTTGVVIVRSAAGVDVRDGEIRIELSQQPTQPNVVASLIARLDGQNTLELLVSSTVTIARSTIGGTVVSMPETRNAAERFLRISEDAGTVRWSVSTDGSAWRELRSAPTPFAFDDIVPTLQLLTSAATAADAVTFDNLNAP